MKIKTNNQTGFLLGVLVLSVALSACSSKPSPWSQQDSPWAANQAGSDAAPEETMVMAEETMPAAEEEPAPWLVEPEATAATAMVEEKVEPEPMMEQQEPMMDSSAMPMAGDLLNQPADYYVVQLCASSSMDKLMAFAKSNDLPDQWTAQTVVDGKTWYVLMLGVYPTKAEADNALSFISEKNLVTRPWVRTVGSVQAVAQ